MMYLFSLSKQRIKENYNIKKNLNVINMIKKVLLIVLIVIGLIAAFETVTASESDLNIDDDNNLTFTSFDQQDGLYKSLKGESPYVMGSPSLTDIWVDPANGNDANSGNTASKPLKTIQEAWNRIPSKIQLTKTGYRIMLKPGVYKQDDMPLNSWMESRYGTYKCPIIIQSAESSKKVELQLSDIMNIYDCRYLYLVGINVQSGANNVLHLEKCDHILIKQVQIKGTGNIDDYSCPQEDLKANQCSFIYLENCDISNAWNVPVDFVGVQNGHILNNRIHEAGDWCMYLKGGSAHFKIEGNELYNSGNGGFTAGQGTGFEYMVSPYIHYETYDIKFINNIVHDTDGAGMGVHGSYNILLAYNTLYKVGKNSHVLEFMHGIRSCDGDTASATVT